MQPSRTIKRYETAVTEAEKRLLDEISTVNLECLTKNFPSMVSFQKRRAQEEEAALHAQHSALLRDLTTQRTQLDAGSVASMQAYCLFLRDSMKTVEGIKATFKEFEENLKKEASRTPPRRPIEPPKMPELDSDRFQMSRHNSESALGGRTPMRVPTAVSPSISTPCVSAFHKSHNAATTPRHVHWDESFASTAVNGAAYRTPRQRLSFGSDDENINFESVAYSRSRVPLKMPVLASTEPMHDPKTPMRSQSIRRVLEFPKLNSDV